MQQNSLFSKRIFPACVVLMGLIVVLVYQDYGIAWDERVQHKYGGFVLDYFLSGGTVQDAVDYKNLFLYGGMFDMLIVAAGRTFPGGEFEIRHLINGLSSILGVIGTYKLTQYLFNARAATLAAILLFIEPFYFGNSFFNPKDIPFAVGYVWTIYYLLKAVPELPALSWRTGLKLGVALGLTLAIRIGAIALIGYIGLALGIALVLPQLWQREHTASFGTRLRQVSIAGLWIAVPAYLLMLAFWPYAQQAPLQNPLFSILEFSNFSYLDVNLLIAGQIHHTNWVPWFYLPVYFLVKTSIPLLGLSLLGLVLLTWQILKGKQLLRGLQLGLLLTAMGLLPFYTIVSQATVYDTMRHFIFELPLMAMFAGFALDCAWQWLAAQKFSPLAKTVSVCVLLAVVIGGQLYALVSLHPYQYVYYNAFVGGVPGADGDYEMEYWASSYKEGVEIAVEFLKERDGAAFADNTYVVATGFAFHSAAYYLPDNMTVGAPEQADVAISFTRWNKHEEYAGTTIAEIRRQGVLLAVVKDLP